MILLCGIPTETPLAMVRRELERQGHPHVLFNQREFSQARFEFGVEGGRVTGRMTLGGRSYRLEDIRGVYFRLMDDRALPELDGEPPDSPARRHCRAIHDAIGRWCEIAPGRVVNRMSPMGSNGSKPFQGQLILDQGIGIPETLITNDPELVREFREAHGQIIYKSISGVRSIVKTLEPEDEPRLDSIRWCPVQFQRYLEGTNVRVHTVGTEVFATAIETSGTDYRYAQREEGGETELRATELSDDLAERCVRLSESLGLAFAGIDLKITPEGEVYCFEVNPSPAYSYYEANTGQPIAAAVARYLANVN